MIKVNDIPVKSQHYPDGTLNTHIEDIVENLQEDAADEVIISWFFEEVEEQVVLYNLVMHLRYALGIEDIILFLPYVPNARMDRVHEIDKEIHALKYFARFINDLKFSAVYIFDPHSDATVSLLDRVVPTSNVEMVQQAVEDCRPDFIFYPDAGAMKRYSKDATLPYLYGDKTREWKTGKITGLEVKNPMNLKPADFLGKRILIVDDICSRGGTFALAATELRKLGFSEIFLYVSHLENTVFAGTLLKEDSPINYIYTTTSLRHAEHPRILDQTISLE